MNWHVVNKQTRSVYPLNHPQSEEMLSHIVVVAIGRWLLSGLDAPDCEATDGISEQEAAMEFIEE